MRFPPLVALIAFLALIANGALPLLAKDSARSILDRMPNQIAGITHGVVHTYDDPRLGASIPFNGDGMTITLYVYDLGLGSIQSGVNDPVIEKAFDEAKGDVQRSPSYSNVRLTGEGPAKFNGKDATLHAQFEMEMKLQSAELQPVFSEIHVFGAWNQIFKLRITLNKEAKADITPKVAEFVGALLKAVEFLPPSR